MKCKEYDKEFFELTQRIRWLTKVDWFGDKMNTQLFIYANADRCHVQRWTIDYCHIKKWKPFPFPLISPPRKVSAPFHFYESKEGIKHSLNLIKWRVHFHIFHKPEKGGVRSQIGSFIICFTSPIEINSFFVSCLENLKWLRRLQKVPFHK